MTGYFKNFEKGNKYLSEDDIAQGPKKFVFQIYPENIKYIETLSYQEKQDLVNRLISSHRRGAVEEDKLEVHTRWLKKSAVTIIAIIICLPLVLYLANVSLKMTKTNYAEMQTNFEKLFEHRGASY